MIIGFVRWKEKQCIKKLIGQMGFNEHPKLEEVMVSKQKLLPLITSGRGEKGELAERLLFEIVEASVQKLKTEKQTPYAGVLKNRYFNEEDILPFIEAFESEYEVDERRELFHLLKKGS